MCLAIPGRIETIEKHSQFDRTAVVKFGDVARHVNVSFVPEANVGDYVLVHVGVAISTIDEAEAQVVFEYLNQIGELAEVREASP